MADGRGGRVAEAGLETVSIASGVWSEKELSPRLVEGRLKSINREAGLAEGRAGTEHRPLALGSPGCRSA